MVSTFSNARMIAWMTWAAASIFYAYQYILRVMPNIMMGDIMQKFQIDAAMFGQFSGIYYIGYSLMHLPIGIWLDRFGPKKVMSGCILLSVLGLMPLIFADHWIYPIIGRLFIGIGSSAAILGVFKIVRMTFQERLFPRMLSFSVTIGLIGAIYGGGPVNYLCSHVGSSFVVTLFAFVGVALAGITYWIIPNLSTPTQTAVFSDVKEVLRNPRVLLTCLFAGLMVGPLEGFADVWASAFLRQVYSFEGTLAASISSMIFIGMCFGSPVLNWIAEKTKNYLLTIIGAGVLMAIAFILLLSSRLSPTILSVNFVLVGVACSYQILAIYKASTYVREAVVGLTTALANMIIMLFGYAFHTTIGLIVNALGGPTSSKALFFGVLIIPTLLIAGSMGFIALFVRERKVFKMEA
ncbi:MAG: MFS transporter [Chlamydiae bacterium]|nr:MFS transporter [Chlamydiota bacterium]